MSRQGSFGRALFAIALASAGIFHLAAQVDTGTISGIVTDSSGAVIPKARVTITQQETDQRIAITANESGFYSAPGLRTGHYSIEVSQQGFQAQKKTGVQVNVQDRLEVNFTLSVGAATSEVTVEAAAPLLESETSSLGQVIQQQTINDLPLNGRMFIQLAVLGAGALPSTRTAERDNFIANGARAVQNSYLLDGIDNKNKILGFDSGSAQVVQPVIDAIDEFKVQTSTFSAEFGQAAGGVVNVTMKSGTNHIHGDLFEFLRNNHLDARAFFQAAGSKPTFIQNQFGATLGLPIIKDKTFFFGSWQSSRAGTAAPQVASVPLASEHQGVFPSTVKDPSAGGSPFPNNTIPLSRWDPVAGPLFALYPVPTAAGNANNFFYSPLEVVNSDSYTIKVDHHFSGSDSMFGRLSQGWLYDVVPTTLPAPGNTNGAANLTQRQVVLSETHLFSGTKVNELRLGFTYTLENLTLDSPRQFEQFGIKGVSPDPYLTGLPTISPTGFTQLGTPTTLGAAPLPAPGGGNRPLEKSGKTWQLLDNFTWIHNRHTMKFGVDTARVTQFGHTLNSARPNFTFNGTYTGNAIGDLLLGDVYSTSVSAVQLITILQYVYSGYAQDDWKISRKITLNYGLRYEVPTPFVEAHNRQSNFVLDSGPCYFQIVLATQAGMCNAGIGGALVRTDTNNFAPRLGVAIQATDKLVVRSGFGIFYGRDENIGLANRLVANPPYIPSASFTGTSTLPAFPLQNGIPAGALNANVGPSTTVYYFPFNYATPYVEQWNINLERQFRGNFVAQIGYTGSEAHKLYILDNLNQALPGPSSIPVNSRRPYQGVGTISEYGPLANSHYDALIAKLERRFSKGISVLSSFTYGHSIDGGGNQNDQMDPAPQNAHNLSAQKGSSNFDVKNRFVTSGVWAEQFGTGAGVLNHLIRDWQFSGIFSTQGGQPFTPILSTDPSNSGSTTTHPNRIADGNLPSGQRSISDWFNLSAFTVPNCVCYGNSGRGILRGPGLINLDFSVVRNFQIKERFRVQFRAESFNLANHPNFGLPNYTIGAAGAGAISTVQGTQRENQLALKLYF
jgi:hypothetical protein